MKRFGLLIVAILATTGWWGVTGQDNKTAEKKVNPIVASVVEWAPQAPCFSNPPIDWDKPELKILDIGNSYTIDAQAYLARLAEAAGLEDNYSLYTAYRGGGSFKNWVDIYNNRDTKHYRVYKCAGAELEGVGGNAEAGDGDLFRQTITNTKWDIILIHQVSVYSNDFSLWDGHGRGGYLNELIEILRRTNPQASIGYLMIHSYKGDWRDNTEGDSLKRWINIAGSTKQFMESYGIDFVIPYGTAVQNLRATSLCDHNEFSNDGTHLANGLGDYVASCCYFQALFGPRFGVSIMGNTYRQTDLDESLPGVLNITDTTAPIAQKAAVLAVSNMWQVRNPEEWEF